ncbi:hypothetical protein [Amycolatopsis solani]|uniref:hypothetical protein n=1 Tax=Amycolatopsis solani TaxID=3028615 RepID=UPI0025B0FD12|nr:hypothetical protein [Amycolatopsis sp. MEP2-6]
MEVLDVAVPQWYVTAGCLAQTVWNARTSRRVLDLVVRPNRVLAPEAVYAEKVARWRERWPEPTVLPWG